MFFVQTVPNLQAQHAVEYEAGVDYFDSQRKEVGAVIIEERATGRVQNNQRAKVTPQLKRVGQGK